MHDIVSDWIACYQTIPSLLLSSASSFKGNRQQNICGIHTSKWGSNIYRNISKILNSPQKTPSLTSSPSKGRGKKKTPSVESGWFSDVFFAHIFPYELKAFCWFVCKISLYESFSSHSTKIFLNWISLYSVSLLANLCNPLNTVEATVSGRGVNWFELIWLFPR